MTTELLTRIGSVKPDNLVVGTDPSLRIGSGNLRKNQTGLKRGTVLAKSSKDATLVPLGTTAESGETLEAYGLLVNDIDVPAGEDVPVEIYIGGKFNTNKILTASGYTMKESDKDTLRKYGIEFAAADNN